MAGMTLITALPILKFALAAAISAIAVTTDLQERRIPGALPAALLFMGLLCGAIGRGLPGLADGVFGAALAFAIFLIPYLLGGMGGGDVKLMSGFGAVTGARGVLPALFLVALAGAMTSLLYLGYQWMGHKAARSSVPYAPAIVLGGLLVAAGQIGAN